MRHTIIIETQSNDDFQLIKMLAERLGLHTNEKHTDTIDTEFEQERIFKSLFENWQGEETGDELNASFWTPGTSAHVTSSYSRPIHEAAIGLGVAHVTRLQHTIPHAN